MAKEVIPALADEDDFETEPRCAAGGDDRGRANSEGGRFDQFFSLAKLGFDIAAEDEVGVDFAGDEEVKGCLLYTSPSPRDS